AVCAYLSHDRSEGMNDRLRYGASPVLALDNAHGGWRNDGITNKHVYGYGAPRKRYRSFDLCLAAHLLEKLLDFKREGFQTRRTRIECQAFCSHSSDKLAHSRQYLCRIP